MYISHILKHVNTIYEYFLVFCIYQISCQYVKAYIYFIIVTLITDLYWALTNQTSIVRRK